MAKQGFTYIPRPYPGTLVQDPAELAGLSKHQIKQWNLTLQGKPISPDDFRNASGVDPTIVVIKGPDGNRYFRNNTCLYAGRSAVFGDVVKWFTLDATISDLAQQATTKAEADPRWGTQPEQVLDETEIRIASTNQTSIRRYNQLLDRALSTASELLVHRR